MSGGRVARAQAVIAILAVAFVSLLVPGPSPRPATQVAGAVGASGSGDDDRGSVQRVPPALSPRPEVATPTPSLAPLAAPPRFLGGVPGEPTPTVIRFRPRHGWTDVDPSAEVSVRFSDAMDRAATAAAFHLRVDGAELPGSRRWAEGDTVLVLRPAAPLPYGARVELFVDATASSAAGVPIAGARSVAFSVEARPPDPTPTPTRAPAPATSAPTGWVWPLRGPITQYFGQELTQYGVHQGIDIDGDAGDQVVAARPGRVVVAGFADECGGLQVRIDHGGGLLSWYRHLSRIDTAVGATVAAGTPIGLVGSTGCSTGSHLHFGLSVGGTFVDPLRYLPPR